MRIRTHGHDLKVGDDVSALGVVRAITTADEITYRVWFGPEGMPRAWRMIEIDGPWVIDVDRAEAS